MNYKDLLEKIIKKQKINIAKIGAEFPYNDVSGEFQKVALDAWTNGFYPGLLWLSYLASDDEEFKNTAILLEEKLDRIIQSFNLPAHDVGFVWLLTSGQHYKLNKNDESKKRLLRMANYLASRFNIKGSFIRVWDSDWDKTTGISIIDCMMNIPLLFWASKQTHDPRFSHIAKAHADTTLKYFIDRDGAIRHQCYFNPESGEFIEALGGQGYSPVSAWSRGAAWAIYGFAMAYYYTKDERYLKASEKAARFFVSNIKDDYIPAWDFRAPNREVKDSSAGAIAASGMIELFVHTNDAFYKEAAEKIISALSEKCMTGMERQAILDKATANLPGNENIEVGLIYGDYYFTEAVYKLAKEDYSLPWEEVYTGGIKDCSF